MFGNNTGASMGGAFGGAGTSIGGGGSLFGANKPNTAGGGLFGGNAFGGQQTAPTGLFGASQTQPNNFGAAGNPQAGGLFGSNPQPQTQMFGQQQTQPNGGLFGVGQNQQQATSLFNSNPQQQQQGGGMFGQPQQQTGGLFGGNQNQGGTGGLFGGQQQQNTGGLFGGGQQSNNGFIGVGGQQTQGTGLFGQPQNGTGAGTGMFGNTQPTQAGGTNLFGNPTANTGFGAQQQQQGANFNFGQAGGATTQGFGVQPNGLFRTDAQQQQQGSLFNTFAANPTTQATTFGQANTTQPNLFGNNPLNNNKLGGTAWGVPTSINNPPSLGGVGQSSQGSLQPVKSKNSKLDAKHMVKCIAALDQFNGLTKEEIRITFIQSGGQQPVLSQQQQAIGVGGNSAFKPAGGSMFGGQTSLPSFGGMPAQTGATTSLFGQQQQQQQPAQGNGIFGQAKPTTAFGTTQAPSLFGQPAQQQQTTSLFGAQQPTQQTAPFGQAGTSLFGQQTNPSVGQPSLFGQQQQQQQPSSIFGNFGQTQQTPSLFGQQPGGQTGQPSLFGQTQTQPAFGQAQPQTSLFGTQPQQTPSLFGTAQPTTSLFGSAPAATSLFGQNPQTAASSFVTPANGAFGQLASPLMQTPTMDPSLQNALPQLLLTYLLSQPQSQDPNHSNNDILKQLLSMYTQGGNAGSNNDLNQTPFDSMLKQARSQQKYLRKDSDSGYSLFSDFQKQPNYYLETANYQTRNPRHKQEQYTISPAQKRSRIDPIFGPDQKYSDISSKKYKKIQDDGLKRISISEEELPKAGNFNIYPSIERLKGYTKQQLKKVERFKVWNDYGEIQILQPVNLLGVDLESYIKISQDNIQISEGELQDKRIRLTFRNFGNYRSLKGEEREKTVKKMRKWISKNQMREILHDQKNGDLIVEVNDS